MPSISIIVPVYNVEKYLEKCLNSLLNQTSDDYEVIVVNDGTKDNSQEIIDRFVEKSPKFKSFIKENGGLSSARNYGIAKSSGQYLLFVDSDDYVELNLVEECLKKIKDYDLIIFEYNQLDLVKNTTEVIKNKYEEDKTYNLTSNPELLSHIHNCAWNKCYKKTLFDDIRYPNGYLYEDLGTTYMLLDKAQKIGFINKPLLNYLLNREGNITTSVSPKIRHIFTMCKYNIEYFRKKDNSNIYEKDLQILCKKNIIECLRKLKDCKDKEFAFKYVDEAFDFLQYYFPKRISLANNLKDNIYENRNLLKLYLTLKGGKNG